MQADEGTTEDTAAGGTGKAPKPIRVFVIGGGCAGLSTAWHLAAQPGFEIHVFEKNPYLGGKGASTRATDGRIQEHGLHVWLGFYENAFRMMRQCYAEVERRGWGPDAKNRRDRLPHARFDEAFLPEPQVGVGGHDAAGRWTLWTSMLPPAPGLPGDALDVQSNPFTLQSYLARCLTLVRALLLSVVGPPGDDGSEALRPGRRASAAVAIEGLAQRLRQGALVGAGVLLQALSTFEDWLRSADFGAGVADSAVELIEALTAQVRRQLRDLVGLDEPLRWKTEVIDIVMTIAVGLYRDRVLLGRQGLDALNDVDYRTWLLRHGATPGAVHSAFMRGIYDLLFAYRDGDREKPALAAGVALRGALRMFFTYRGAMFWKMRSGMGETVFSPLYKVLGSKPMNTPQDRAAWPSRPVHFHLGHELTHLRFEGGREQEGGLRVAELGFDEYRLPGRALDDYGCWREPKRAVKRVDSRQYLVDRDFDAVVFAAGPDAMRDGAGKVVLQKLLPDWAEMTHRVKTVATRSAQLWLPCTLSELGWKRGPAVVSALEPPFETWADMSHVLPGEQGWREAHGVDPPPTAAKSVVYLCGVEPKAAGDRSGEALRADLAALLKGGMAASEAVPPPDQAEPWWSAIEKDPQAWLALFGGLVKRLSRDPQLMRAMADALDSHQGASAMSAELSRGLSKLLQRERRLLEPLLAPAPQRMAAGGDSWLQAFWPQAFEPVFVRDVLPGVLESAYCRLNTQGSERYTLSLPRSVRYRVSPLDDAVSNLSLAGDWTACGLDAGCVEAAVMSGMLAAHALSGGTPTLDQIVGFDHP